MTTEPPMRSSEHRDDYNEAEGAFVEREGRRLAARLASAYGSAPLAYARFDEAYTRAGDGKAFLPVVNCALMTSACLLIPEIVNVACTGLSTDEKREIEKAVIASLEHLVKTIDAEIEAERQAHQ